MLRARCRRLQYLIAIALVAVTAVHAAAAPLDGSRFAPSVAAAVSAADTREPSQRNQIANISGGYDALLLRVHLIRQAKSSINIQTFIWTNDECGRLVLYELN